MKPSEVIAIVVAFLGLAGAFQGFVAVDLYTKLITIAVSEGLVLWIASRRLAEWARTKKSTGFGSQPRSRPLKKPMAAAALAIIAVLFSIGAWQTVWLYAVNIEIYRKADQLVLWVSAPMQLVNQLDVSVPLASRANCMPEDDPRYPAHPEMFAWDSSNPILRLTDFSYPQRQGLSCSSSVASAEFGFIQQPATIQVFRPERRRAFLALTLAFGGVTWLLSVVWVFCRSS